MECLLESISRDVSLVVKKEAIECGQRRVDSQEASDNKKALHA
jgi:hypothetical protein